ncbi:MAG: hypothetical protein J7502_14020, partial [Flavisolibacter sp.]|nr:hypothetical protein [Flavisolibacter sp.]
MKLGDVKMNAMLQRIFRLFLLAVFSFISLSCNKKEDKQTPATVVPAVKVESTSVERTTADALMHFTVSLDETP